MASIDFHNRTVTGLTVDASALALIDDTTNNVLTSRHGFAPKLPNDATKFLNGVGGYTVPPGTDAVSSVFGRTGAVVAATNDYTEAQLSFSDITTNNVSTSKHGFAPKAPNDVTKYLDGTGAYSVPAGSGGIVAKIYDFTISGSDQASIDTAVDGTTVANFAGHDILAIWMILRTDEAGAAVNVDLNVNNDTGAKYDQQFVVGVAATATTGTNLAQTKWTIATHGSGGTAGYASANKIEMPGYAGTTFNKDGTMSQGYSDATAGNNRVGMYKVGFRDTAAITRFKVAAQGAAKLKVGSRLIVYGS